MPIAILCECGKSLKASEQHIGRKARCPACGATVRIEQPAASTRAPAVELLPDSPPFPGSQFQFKDPAPNGDEFNFAEPSANGWSNHVAATPSRKKVRSYTIEDLRDVSENTALTVLLVLSIPVWIGIVAWVVLSLGIPLLFIAMIMGSRYLAEFFAGAYLKCNAIRVSESQLPEVHLLLKRCCERMEIDTPDLFIVQESLWNAMARKLAGRHQIVLYSGAVDSLLLHGDYQALSFVIGHEVGHIAAGHLGFVRGTCASFGGWLPWFYLWYRRRREFTCDRVGLYCAGLAPSLAAMVNLTVGARLASQVDVEEAIEQWEEYRREFFVNYRNIYATHPFHLNRLAELKKSAEELGIA